MAILVRRLLENEIELANDFFNSIYKTNRSLVNFRWEFLEGPNGPAVYVLAVDESITTRVKVVGIQCAIPLELQNVRGEIVATAKSEDTLVDPEYRGQKVFERMYDFLFEECRKAGIEFIWGFTPAKKAFERIGFQIPFQAHQALMVFGPTKAYSYLSSLNLKNRNLDKVKIAGLAALSKLLSILKVRRPALQLVVKQVETGSKDKSIQTLWSKSSLYFLRMDKSYIEWRVNNNPFNNRYESYEFFSAGTFVADVILNFRPEGFGYIEQVIFGYDLSEEVKTQILLHIIEIMKPRVSFIRALCFETNEELQLQTLVFKKSGFIVLKRGGYFVWRSIGSRVLNPNNIFLTRLFTQGNQ